MNDGAIVKEGWLHKRGQCLPGLGLGWGSWSWPADRPQVVGWRAWPHGTF